MRTASAMVLVIVAAVILGCQHGPYAAQTYRAGTTSYEHTERLIFTDRTLVSKIRLVSLRDVAQDDGRLKVYAELENRTSKNLVVQVQTQYRDAAGMLTADESNWRTIVMPPNSVTSYENTSLNDQAKDFVIRVKTEKEH